MPDIPIRQRNGRYIDLALDSIVVIEPCKITGLGGDINSIGDPPVPQRGSLHPDQVRYPGAVLSNVRLVQWINLKTALVNLVYRRQLTGWGGGPRRIVSAYSLREYIDIPVWNKVVRDGITQYIYNPVKFPRMVAIRDEVRYLSGNQVQTVQDAVISNSGKYYNIGLQDPRPLYMLSDKTSVFYDGLSYTRAEYRFERPAELLGIPENHPEYRNSVAIPALPAHYNYVTYENETVSNLPPVIKVVAPPAAFGGPLPGFA